MTIAEHFREILKLIGEDPDREGLRETPERIERMYKELFRGYGDPPKLTTFPNNCDGVCYNQIITDSGPFFSQCEHHAVFFFGSYNFGYIPDKKIIGLSKVARVIDHYSARLQIQERLGQQIVDYIEEIAQPKGVILQLRARHLCKEFRGIKKIGGEMTTSIIRGVFEKDQQAKDEFYNLIK